VELGLTGDWIGAGQAVRIFNLLFSWGFVAGTVLVAVVTFVFSPFIGMFVAGVSFMYSLARTFGRAEGRLVTDIIGVSDLVDQSTAMMLEEMGIADGHPTLSQATSVPQPPPNFPGAPQTQAPLMQNSYVSYSTGPAPSAVPASYASPMYNNPVAYQPQHGQMYPQVHVATAGSQAYQAEDPSTK
jgi:phosphate/sulfate permease